MGVTGDVISLWVPGPRGGNCTSFLSEEDGAVGFLAAFLEEVGQAGKELKS